MYHAARMDENPTTIAVQHYLDDLAHVDGASEAEPIVRQLLARSVDRLHQLCATLLYRDYPRLTRGPLNLCADELLGAVVERLLKAMRSVRPGTVRQFFALVNRHMRWELNDLARRLDHGAAAVELHDSRFASPPPPPGGDGASSASTGAGLARILAAIEELPEDEHEAFNLVRLQGMTFVEAAEVLGVSTKTVQRRLNRCLSILSERLGDLVHDASAEPQPQPPPA